jgi:fatty acid-binding protein DegV
VKPILAFDDGEVRRSKRVRGRSKASGRAGGDLPQLDGGPGRSEPPRGRRPRRGEGGLRRARSAGAGRAAERRRSTSSRTLGPVIGTHGGQGTLGLFWFWDSLARSQPR